MKIYPKNFGGWIASTDKNPDALMETIWSRARRDETGLIGFSDYDKKNLLIFKGVQIRIKDKDPISKYLGYSLALEITDGAKIMPKFFDLWEYLKANHHVGEGPDQEDKAFFCSGKYAELQELDIFVDKYYSMPISRTFTRMSQLGEVPMHITERKITDRAREREEGGENFQYKITRKKKENRFDG